MDAELWAALSGYDVALQRAYRWRRISPPKHETGRLFGELLPQTLEDVRLFCFRIAPAVDRALGCWLRLGEEDVADALERLKRLIRYVLEQDDGEQLPGIPLDYEELNLG